MAKEENEITKQIFEYLNLCGVMAWRTNNLAVKGRAFAGRKGVPDILGILKGRFLGIEVKTDKGKQSEEQMMFENDCKGAGGLYILARNVDDVMSKI